MNIEHSRENRYLGIGKLLHYGDYEVVVREQSHQRLRRVRFTRYNLAQDVHRWRGDRLLGDGELTNGNCYHILLIHTII